jgi:hypothetical protein
MQYYKPEHFDIVELVPRSVHEDLGEKAWLLFDPLILMTADQIRDFFGAPCFVNDWANGGTREYRGFRPSDCVVGASYSQHRFGRALDISVTGVTGTQVRDVIMNHQEHFPFITRIEDDVPHLHVDCALVFHRGIYLFTP